MTQEELDSLISGNDLGGVLNSENKIREELVSRYEKQTEALDGHQHKHLDEQHLVHQLDEVTQESEQKAVEIFDKLEKVLNELDYLEASFADRDLAKVKVNEIRDLIFEIMSIMQYQDIHRQKIERVINTMTAISKMMNSALDSVRTYVPSAKHISGDKDTLDLIDNDDIEALVATMQNK